MGGTMKQAPRAVVGLPACLLQAFVKTRIWQWGSGRDRAGMRLCVRWVRKEVKFVEAPGGDCESLGLGLG